MVYIFFSHLIIRNIQTTKAQKEHRQDKEALMLIKSISFQMFS